MNIEQLRKQFVQNAKGSQTLSKSNETVQQDLSKLHKSKDADAERFELFEKAFREMKQEDILKIFVTLDNHAITNIIKGNK